MTKLWLGHKLSPPPPVWSKTQLSNRVEVFFNFKRGTFSTLSHERPINTHLRHSSCRIIGETHSNKGLLIYSLNAPSILKHKGEIEILIKENKIDILAINQTKLDNRIKDDTVAIDCYTVKRFILTETGMVAGLPYIINLRNVRFSA